MSRPLRYCQPEMMVEVTTRTIQGRLLLRPSPELNEIVLGILGRALSLYPLRLHAFIFLSNHYELLLSTPDTQTLSRFMNFVNGNLAKEAGRLYDWRDKFWSRRYRSVPIIDKESQVPRLRYLLSNGCKEGLVSSPREWPGASSTMSLLDGRVLRGAWHDRTAEYRAGKRRSAPSREQEFVTRYEVPLAPLPCWASLPPAEQQARTAALVSEIEEQTRCENRDAGKRPLGVAAVLRQDPHAKPLDSSRSPAPLCHAACQELRRAFLEAYEGFARRFRMAARLLASEGLRVPFPEHCFPPAPPYIGLVPS